MPKRVKLGMEALEVREVPAAFSFQLPDGRAGLGTFSTPDGVNEVLRVQVLDAPDLAVSLDGEAYTVSGTATATYEFGVLTGVTLTADGPTDTIDVSGTTATVGTDTATIALDAADTQATFELSDGTAGAMSYDVPWDSVDPTQATQSVSLSNFVLNIAGQNLTPGIATFTTSPTVQFENGALTGITFAINTSSLASFAYSSVSATGSTISAVVKGSGATIAAALAGTGTVTLDFGNVKGDTGIDVIEAGTITITVTTKDNKTYTSTLTFDRGISTQALAETVASDLVQQGLTTAKVSGNRVTFNGNANDPLATVSVYITNNSKPRGIRSAGVTLDISRN